MIKICVINNFNYSQFLSDCLNSVFNQTVPFDKVVIVDDGSTDQSTEIINNFCKNYSNLIPILKKNEGQLSCFNAAYEYIEEESQVFFLDSDDIYPRDFLELILDKLNGDMFDLVYVSAKKFSNIADIPLSALCNSSDDLVWNKTSALVRMWGIWLGDVTSTLSISGKVYKSLLPYPYQEDWRSRADDVIIYGASIIGAKKLSIPSLSIGYRRHSQSDATINNNEVLTPEKQARRDQNLMRLFDYYCARFQLKRSPEINEIFEEYGNLCNAAKTVLKDCGYNFP